MRKMTLASLAGFLAVALASGPACQTDPKSDYRVKAVPFTSVNFTDGFWATRQQTDIAVTISHEMKETEKTGRIKNFELAAAALAGATDGKLATRYAFDDSDVYKLIEAAATTLRLKPNPELEKSLDSWIAKIAAAQEPDGYLYTARTINPKNPPRMSGPERWVNLKDSHELYNVGHLYEAAVVHHQATGKRNLLDVALKSADFIERTFGPAEKKEKRVPGHEEIEIGLVKLFRLTGKTKYLKLAKFFIDQRGNAEGHELYGEYAQDHKPVIEQAEAVGHAVRATYLYSGMTDVAALTGDGRYLSALDRIWEDIVRKKLYLTGGIGAAGGIEGFGPDYDLPNPSGYAETCATIAYALWNWRMSLYSGDGKYMDLFERAVYNAFLSGFGMTGDLFFYPNPLASRGQHERTPWFACACCPPNVARFIAQMGQFVYGVEGDKVYVNLYGQSSAEVETEAGRVVIEQTTAYPWEGDIKIRLVPAKTTADLTLMVRLPGWALGQPLPGDLYRYADETAGQPKVMVNGEALALNVEKGYLPIRRSWQPDDTVEIVLPMPVRRVLAHENVKADVGRVAVERGPLVYCAEWTDHDGAVSNLVLDDSAILTAEARPDMLGGITVITGEATAYREKSGRAVGERRRLVLIPYYAWAHRGKGEMEVWIAREADKARAIPEPTLASEAKPSASAGVNSLPGINDLIEPSSSHDLDAGYAHWWPKKGSVEWVQYDFARPTTVSETAVYWFDDTGSGECRAPVSWKALVRSGDRWVPVKNLGPYGTEKDRYNSLKFSPVRTGAIRLEVQFPKEFSCGIQEWKVR